LALKESHNWIYASAFFVFSVQIHAIKKL